MVVATPSVTAVGDGRTIAVDTINRRLTDSWLDVGLAKGESVRVYDLTVQATEPSKAIVGASSEYLFAACLSGEIRAAGQTASVGQVIIWKHDAEYKPTVRRFSAREFQQTLKDKGATSAANALALVADNQKTARFWGTQRVSGVNIGSPLQPTAEDLRREYLLQDQILSLRRSAAENLPQATARAATAALAKGDAAALSQLLTPAYFRDPAKQARLNEARLAMAKQLIANLPNEKPDATKLKPASTATAPSAGLPLNTRAFTVSAGASTITIEVGPFDSGWFVTAIR